MDRLDNFLSDKLWNEIKELYPTDLEFYGKKMLAGTHPLTRYFIENEKGIDDKISFINNSIVTPEYKEYVNDYYEITKRREHNFHLRIVYQYSFLGYNDTPFHIDPLLKRGSHIFYFNEADNKEGEFMYFNKVNKKEIKKMYHNIDPKKLRISEDGESINSINYKVFTKEEVNKICKDLVKEDISGNTSLIFRNNQFFVHGVNTVENNDRKSINVQMVYK